MPTKSKYADITGISTKNTALINISPTPGHWNTVSVIMAKATIEREVSSKHGLSPDAKGGSTHSEFICLG